MFQMASRESYHSGKFYFGRRIKNKSIKQNGGREHMFTRFITKVSFTKGGGHGFDNEV